MQQGQQGLLRSKSFEELESPTYTTSVPSGIAA